LAALEPAAFVYILKSLTKGLAALGVFKILELDNSVCNQIVFLDSAIYISCCTILDSIVSYIFKQLQMKGKSESTLSYKHTPNSVNLF